MGPRKSCLGGDKRPEAEERGFGVAFAHQRLERRNEGVETDESFGRFRADAERFGFFGHFDRRVLLPLLNPMHLFQPLNQPRPLHRIELPAQYFIGDQEASRGVHLPRIPSPSGLPARSLHSETVPMP